MRVTAAIHGFIRCSNIKGMPLASARLRRAANVSAETSWSRVCPWGSVALPTSPIIVAGLFISSRSTSSTSVRDQANAWSMVGLNG